MHEHKCLSSFLFFRFQSFFKLRERERVYKIGYEEKRSQSLLILFRWIPVENLSSFYGLFFYPEFLALVPSATNPVQQLIFLFSFFHLREEGGTSVLGSQPIIWLLPSSFLCQATRVRSQSINICGSPLWPTFFTLTACYC